MNNTDEKFMAEALKEAQKAFDNDEFPWCFFGSQHNI